MKTFKSHVRTVTCQPCAKTFLIDPYGVIEARALHADCILLIVACLSDQQLEEMSKTAFET